MAKAKAEAVETKEFSQMEMVRQALDELSFDASPRDLQSHIEGKFGRAIDTTVISNYKSQIKSKAGAKSAGPGRPRKTTGSAIPFEDLEAVRALVTKLGPDQVHKLVDVFTR